MDAKVWVSQVKTNSALGDKLGLRWKLFGETWAPATHIRGVPTDEYVSLIRQSDQGYALDRSSFPEALAVWNRKSFAKVGDFFWANGFAAVKGRLAKVLSRFDFGDGGLIPLPVYQEDLTTPQPGPFFLVNFGARKDSLIAEQSNLRKFYIDPDTGRQLWKVPFGPNDGDVALTPTALIGADVWNEERRRSVNFMSDAPVTAIREAGVKIDFQLSQCRIVETV
jgi:hypothetical protein